jgi:hypothetical protein
MIRRKRAAREPTSGSNTQVCASKSSKTSHTSAHLSACDRKADTAVVIGDVVLVRNIRLTACNESAGMNG